MTKIKTIYVQVPVHVAAKTPEMMERAESAALAAVRSASGHFVSLSGADWCDARADFKGAVTVEESNGKD